MSRAFVKENDEQGNELPERPQSPYPNHVTPRGLDALHQQLEQAARPGSGSRDRFFELNEKFHRRLLELADNRWRAQLVADLRKVMKLNRQGSLFKAGRIEQSLAEHRAILAALLERDAELAAQRMRQHFASGLQAAA